MLYKFLALAQVLIPSLFYAFYRACWYISNHL
nr:MAG TPA: hypothetical protein [Crassvirales sp.]